MPKLNRCRNRSGKALTAEFACALTVFLLIILFPLINLIGMGMAAGTQYILTVNAATRAGTATTYGDALTAMAASANEITASGFGKFGKLQPIAGFSGSGTDLFIQVTPLGGGSTTNYGPNTPFAGAIDPNANVYEYQVRSIFDVGPFVNLGGFPFIGNVPGVGRPARFSFVASRMVEFDQGLAMGGNGTGLAGAGGGGSGGGSGPIASSGGGTGSGSGGDGSLNINGINYTPNDIRWWNNHADDTDPWNNQPNPFMNPPDPSMFSNGQQNPYWP